MVASSIVLREDIVDGTAHPNVSAHIILHEAAHAISVAEIATFPKLASTIEDLMLHVDAHLSENDPAARGLHDYAFKNVKEFIAEAFSKEDFQNELEKIPLTPSLAKRLGFREATTVWDAVKNTIRELWNKLTGKEVPEKAIDALFRIGQALTEANKIVEEMLERGEQLDLARR